jgi:hypothetical protein
MLNDNSRNVAAGLAALSICESLIICLIEKGILDAMEFDAILESARDAHEHCRPQRFTREDHDLAAAMITQIINRSNAVRGASFL